MTECDPTVAPQGIASLKKPNEESRRTAGFRSRRDQISTGAPNSTSRVDGIRKKSVAEAALRCI